MNTVWVELGENGFDGLTAKAEGGNSRNWKS